MKYFRGFFLLLCLGMTAACAKSTSRLSAKAAQAIRSTPPQEGVSRAVMCRERTVLFGAAVTMNMSIDGRPLGPLAFGGCFVVEVNAGEHALRAEAVVGDKSPDVHLTSTFRSGETIFFWIHTSFGPVPNITPMPPEKGQKTFSRWQIRKPYVSSLVDEDKLESFRRSKFKTQPMPTREAILSLLGTPSDTNIQVAMLPIKFGPDAAQEFPQMVFEDAVMSVFSGTGAFEIIGNSDIESLLEAEKTKDLMGCDDTVCFKEIGGALGVPYMLVVSVAHVGKDWALTGKIMDVRSARVVLRNSSLISDESSSDVLRQIPGFVAGLLTPAR